MMVKKEWNFRKDLHKSKAWIHFEDGTSFSGFINLSSDDPKIRNGIWGEAAFTTGMSGYEETATDPSFLGQHIIYTTAHVGNYPSDENVRQSSVCHATALIARSFSANDFLENLKTPLFTCKDTRALVKYLTKVSSHKSCISLKETTPTKEEFKNAKLICDDLHLVSQKEIKVLKAGDNPIVLVNYGVKNAIVNNLLALNYPLVSVPYDADPKDIINLKPRLIFLSNGPGDPRNYKDQISQVKTLLLSGIPVRGICLGHQLISLALGAEVIKLPYGQRGINHPVIDHQTGKIVITSQNHGYAAHEPSLRDILKNNILKRELFIQHTSLFDLSVEGISTVDGHLKSVQFHPESCPGPDDAKDFFAEIGTFLKGNHTTVQTQELHSKVDIHKIKKKTIPFKRILIIGSGPIKIGQASEFDYSGTQACKALKAIGLEVILLNSNPATIMTDPEMADRTYIEPITTDVIKSICKKENVDAVISTLGGQTALNICIELDQEDFFKKNNISLLGANPDTIRKTEDRDLFAKELDKLGYQSGKRYTSSCQEDALKLADNKVGFPLIIRRDFALGGRGAALVYTSKELQDILENTDVKYPITMEKSLVGQKEVELEVMVDCEQNGVIICSIENVDPCGIHTGDSITVAPAQTISDVCYQNMRTMALRIAKHMGVVAGGANVQFAINPLDENDITVIEMNPRVSRSSALASKATGYPIAKISALLAVGYNLKEIINDITNASPVCFEPTLDYVAVKIPIFPFNKFPTSSTKLGPQMRSVGEVLALGGSFNEAFMKALRALELGLEIPTLTQLKTSPLQLDHDYLKNRLENSHELSLVTVMDCLRLGMTPESIQHSTRISPWFIGQVGQITEAEDEIKKNPGLLEDYDHLFYYKSLGLSDKHLAMLSGKSHREVFDRRFNAKLFPIYKAVDTCSGEFQAQTPYFYSTYAIHNDAKALSSNGNSVIVMGSGPNRIGQGIEFDYSCVKACNKLRERKKAAIMVNSNPETVSTDYDSSDRLYLTPLYSEDLFDIYLQENPMGIIACFSGQTGIKLRKHLEDGFRKNYIKINFLGPDLATIDATEDRKQFEQITRTVDLAHTNAMEVKGHKKLVNAILEIGPPVIIRPSYVIGGESMYIFNSVDDIAHLPPKLQEQLKMSATTFQVENYLQDAIEYDVDLVRDNFGNTVFTVCEHIEHAGVHSGDSGMITPAVYLTHKLYEKLKRISRELAEKLKVVGPINFQYAIKDGQIYCIEANPRGSRTLPFLSKAYSIDLPGLATDALLGLEIPNWDREVSPFYAVKQSTFPFDRFVQDNIILGPKMRSTGETMGLDPDKDKASMKSYLGNYPGMGVPGKILISLSDSGKTVLLPYLKRLQEMGFEFYATSGTCSFIRKQGVNCQVVARIGEQGLTLLDILKNPQMRMVFNTPLSQGSSKSDGERIRNTAIQYGVPCFTRKENIRAVIESILGTYGGNSPGLEPFCLHDTRKDL